MNCLLWFFYGLPIVHSNSTLVLTINGIGLVIEGAYIIIFIIYAAKNTRVRTCNPPSAPSSGLLSLFAISFCTEDPPACP